MSLFIESDLKTKIMKVAGELSTLGFQPDKIIDKMKKDKNFKNSIIDLLNVNEKEICNAVRKQIPILSSFLPSDKCVNVLKNIMNRTEVKAWRNEAKSFFKKI